MRLSNVELFYLISGRSLNFLMQAFPGHCSLLVSDLIKGVEENFDTQDTAWDFIDDTLRHLTKEGLIEIADESRGDGHSFDFSKITIKGASFLGQDILTHCHSSNEADTNKHENISRAKKLSTLCEKPSWVDLIEFIQKMFETII